MLPLIINMIIEIESFFGDCLLHGPRTDDMTLRSRMNELIALTDMKDFVKLFCVRYGYEILPWDETVQVDYVMDLDIYRIYRPRYERKINNDDFL